MILPFLSLKLLNKRVNEIRVFIESVALSYIGRKKTLLPQVVLLNSSLIIVKSLQLRGHRQIAEPRKYCLVHMIVFLWHVFSLFLFLTGWEFGEIPYRKYTREVCKENRHITLF